MHGALEGCLWNWVIVEEQGLGAQVLLLLLKLSEGLLQGAAKYK